MKVENIEDEEPVWEFSAGRQEFAIEQKFICRACERVAKDPNTMQTEFIDSEIVPDVDDEGRLAWWIQCRMCPRVFHLRCFFPEEDRDDFLANRNGFYCQWKGCRFNTQKVVLRST